MAKLSLTKNIIGSEFVKDGILASAEGEFYKCIKAKPLSSGLFEEHLNGQNAELFFNKLSDLITRLPNLFEGQIIFVREKINSNIKGLSTNLYFFEKVSKPESYSHLKAILNELKFNSSDLSLVDWNSLLTNYFGNKIKNNTIPDLICEKNFLQLDENLVKVLSLTELPQITWKGCLSELFSYHDEFVLSLKLEIPDRNQIKKKLETKRRVSHALSISSSLEVRNIESNSVLSTSEETLERILVGKETLFEISMAIILNKSKNEALESAYNFERVISGIGNAGLFKEGVGTLPAFKSHIPTNKFLSMRKLPILSNNLAEMLPLFLDYSTQQENSSLELRSRNLEKCNLNLFSPENLNFNSFICGASGSGKSFLMNAMLLSQLKDEPKSRLCIFDVGGSYRKIVTKYGGQSISLTLDEANQLIATYLKSVPVNKNGFFKSLIELLCGSGKHLTHSHLVAIEDLLSDFDGSILSIKSFIDKSLKKDERCYHDLALWLKPHLHFDEVKERKDLNQLITSKISAFDFKSLDANPIIQKVTIFLLSELLWKDLEKGTYPKTIIVFDEVWRFFSMSKGYLEEFYRTLRKYKAGIVTITQNLADYGDEAFAKMIFTNSFTKIFLQNGVTKDYLKNTFDLPASDIERALSVNSQKPKFSEFFVLTQNMSQVFRLYPDPEFYELAQTENISSQ